jgi:hypothetical protein
MPLLTPIVLIYNTIAIKNPKLVSLLQSYIYKVNLRLAFINNLSKTY